QPSKLYEEKAGIFAEFGKIVCIGLGFFENETHDTIRLKHISSHNEKELLEEFFAMLHKLEKNAEVVFCGHNIKEFDLAFICRRAVIYQLELPVCLSLSNVKPWLNPHLDTLELWRFGDYKHYITLDLLAITL